MRQMRQVLRLHAEGQSIRAIGRSVGPARSTVQDALRRAAAAGLVWPLPEAVTDAGLEEAIVRAREHTGRSTASCRTRLGVGSTRAEAAGDVIADFVGRISGQPS